MLVLRRIAALLTVLILSLSTSAFGSGPKPVRVGVIGVDNYQAVAYTQLFNDPKAAGDLAGLRVVAAFPAAASDDIPESVESFPKWKADIVKFDVKLVSSIDELLRGCDAVMIMSLDGRKHLEQEDRRQRLGARRWIRSEPDRGGSDSDDKACNEERRYHGHHLEVAKRVEEVHVYSRASCTAAGALADRTQAGNCLPE